MNNEEAIAILKRATLFEPKLENKDYPEAFELAIKALEETRPKGKWEKHSIYDGVLICSNCNRGSTKYSTEFSFCPSCGADMRGDV